MIGKLITWAAGPALPFIAGGVVVALIGGAWTIDHRAYARGVNDERGAWTDGVEATAAAYAEAALDAAQLRAAGYGKVDTSTRKQLEGIKAHYETRPIDRDSVCLPGDRVRAVDAARQAIAAAAFGSGSGTTDADAWDQAGEPEAPFD